MESLIQHFGYLAILVGTFLEGETILVMGGFAAHRGYLKLPFVFLMAFIGTALGDQLFFFLGRFRSEATLKKHPSWKPSIDRARSLLDRHQLLIILIFRFLYGLRIITPFAIGMSRFPTRTFVPLNILGAGVWAAVFSVVGYFFGSALEKLLGDFKRYELEALAGIAAAGFTIWLWHFYQRKRRLRRASINS